MLQVARNLIDMEDGFLTGHDKFPPDSYQSRRSKRARALTNRVAQKRARAWARAEIHKLWQ